MQDLTLLETLTTLRSTDNTEQLTEGWIKQLKSVATQGNLRAKFIINTRYVMDFESFCANNGLGIMSTKSSGKDLEYTVLGWS